MSEENGEKEHSIGLKKFRKRMDFKQNQLAEMLNVSPVAYNFYEKGKNEPDFKTYKKLFELGATVEELFGVRSLNKILPKTEITSEEAADIVKKGLNFLFKD